MRASQRLRREYLCGARQAPPSWGPVEHCIIWGQPCALPAGCICDRQLGEPHSEPSCPYSAPELWYSWQVELLKGRAPA